MKVPDSLSLFPFEAPSPQINLCLCYTISVYNDALSGPVQGLQFNLERCPA